MSNNDRTKIADDVIVSLQEKIGRIKISLNSIKDVDWKDIRLSQNQLSILFEQLQLIESKTGGVVSALKFYNSKNINEE